MYNANFYNKKIAGKVTDYQMSIEFILNDWTADQNLLKICDFENHQKKSEIL